MCVSLEWLKDVLIWLILIAAGFALLRLLAEFLGPRLRVSAEVLNFIIRALWIVVWAMIGIAAVTFIIGLIACLMPSIPRLR